MREYLDNSIPKRFVPFDISEADKEIIDKIFGTTLTLVRPYHKWPLSQKLELIKSSSNVLIAKRKHDFSLEESELLHSTFDVVHFFVKHIDAVNQDTIQNDMSQLYIDAYNRTDNPSLRSLLDVASVLYGNMKRMKLSRLPDIQKNVLVSQSIGRCLDYYALHCDYKTLPSQENEFYAKVAGDFTKRVALDHILETQLE